MDNRITEGNVSSEALRFFSLVFLGSFIQLLYTTADSVIVGQCVGKGALAAVAGPSGTLILELTFLFNGFAAGVSSLVAHLYGSGRLGEVNRSVHTAYAASVVFGVLLAIVGFVFAPGILSFMSTPQDIMGESVSYLRISMVGVAPMLIYNMGSALMRGLGDSRRPTLVLAACGATNVLLDLLLVAVFRRGVAGAAVATVVAQMVSAFLVSQSLARTYRGVKLQWRETRIRKDTLVDELKIGLPGALQASIFSITNVIVQMMIDGFGTDSVAAYAVFEKADMLCWMLCGSVGTTVATFVAQNHGAHLKRRISKSLCVCIAYGCIALGAVIILLVSFSDSFAFLFVGDEAVVGITSIMIRLIVPTYLLFLFVEIFMGALRGLGNVVVPSMFNVGTLLLMRIPWLLWYVPLHHDIRLLLIAYPLSWLGTLVLLVPYFSVIWKRTLSEPV